MGVEEGEPRFESLKSPTPDTPSRRLREVSRDGDVIKVKVHAYETHGGREHEYIRACKYDARTGRLLKEGKWIDITPINDELAKFKRTLDDAFPLSRGDADALRARARLFGDGRVTGKKPKVEK